MGPGRRQRDFTPVTWDKYFTTKEDITISDGAVSLFVSFLLCLGLFCYFLFIYFRCIGD